MNKKDRVQGMVGAAMRWTDVSPKAVVSGSTAQAENVLKDARTDILALWKACEVASEEIETLREENARLRAETNVWQPIETAPKDGSPVIGLRYDGDIALCWWQQEFEAFISSAHIMTLAKGYTFEGGKAERLHSPVIEPVSYWMPFPPPPNKGDE